MINQDFIVGMVFLTIGLLFVMGIALIVFQEYFSSQHAKTIEKLEKDLELANKRVLTLEDSLSIYNHQLISNCPVITTKKVGKKH